MFWPPSLKPTSPTSFVPGCAARYRPAAEHVLRLLPPERLLPRGIAEARVILEAEVTLIRGKHVVAVRVERRRPADDGRVAVRVEAVHDDDGRRVARMQRELAEERRAVARRELHRSEPRWPRRGVGAARNGARRVVLRRRGVEDVRVAERAVEARGHVVRLVRLGENLLQGGAETSCGAGRSRAREQGGRRDDDGEHEKSPHGHSRVRGNLTGGSGMPEPVPTPQGVETEP